MANPIRTWDYIRPPVNSSTPKDSRETNVPDSICGYVDGSIVRSKELGFRAVRASFPLF